MMKKPGKNRGQCWKKDCEEKYVISLNVKIVDEFDRSSQESEYRACKKHFKENWIREDQSSYKNRIEDFLK